jgi:uncharacterized membrane protein
MDLTSLAPFGNLHLVMLHLPIGFVVAAVLVEVARRFRGVPEVTWWQNRLLAVNAVATLVTAALGLLLAANNPYPAEALNAHRWAGVVCAGLAVVTWVAHQRGGRAVQGVMLAALAVATLITGHRGAVLTHGPAVAAWWPRKDAKPAARTAAADDEKVVQASVYQREIEPMLARHCYECHGNGKAKGKLRLDDREAALRGGKSGRPAIVVGDAAASELVRRVKLPRDDDEAMPGGDEPGLSATEIATLERWITDGARMGRTND